MNLEHLLAFLAVASLFRLHLPSRALPLVEGAHLTLLALLAVAPETVEEHLLAAFGERLLGEITIADVEGYAAEKLGQGKLAPRSINATIALLAQILDAAMDRELVGRNVARGRGRKVRERAPARSYLETAGEIEALLDGAGRLDHEAREDRQHVERRASLATMTFAGLRIGELCALRWRDGDLAAGWLSVGESKTDAGRRRVKIRGALRDELVRIRAKLDGVDQDHHVFATRTGRRPSGDNIRSRVLNAAVENVNEDLARRDLSAIAEQAHAALAAPDLLLAALRARRGPGHRHGRNGRRGSRPRAEGLPPGDAPRRG